jgi:predicted glutamine amidotransferase
MCRLLGMVAARPGKLTELLSAELGPFTDLSAHHCDGWGISYWNENDDLVIAKAPETARSSESYRHATNVAHTDLAVLHLRKASPGMANVAANTHPFIAGSVAFAHNGYFTPVQAAEALVDATGGHTYDGQTDSERYFALVLAGIRNSSPAHALSDAATQIAAVAEVVSLNALLLTNTALYAIAFHNEDVIAKQRGDISSFGLKYRTDADKVVVASSGWDQDAPHWEPLPNRSILEVRRHDCQVSVHKIPASIAAPATT